MAEYTREAGVRQLEREIGRVMRHAAVQVADGSQAQVRVDAADLDAILGPAKFEHETALRSSVPGVATGLAWTPVGGDILFIEATRVAGTRPADPDRPAGRRDEGKRPGRADAGEVVRQHPADSGGTLRRH